MFHFKLMEFGQLCMCPKMDELVYLTTWSCLSMLKYLVAWGGLYLMSRYLSNRMLWYSAQVSASSEKIWDWGSILKCNEWECFLKVASFHNCLWILLYDATDLGLYIVYIHSGTTALAPLYWTLENKILICKNMGGKCKLWVILDKFFIICSRLAWI